MSLVAKNLCAGYGRLVVLHDISLVVPERGLVAILGPNGAGKSTLLKTIARLLPVKAGELRLRGERYDHREAPWAARNGIALVPQDGDVFADLTVAENLTICARLAEHPRSAIAQTMEAFPILRERSDQAAGSLSGGERKLLAIASALLTNPDLLLLDEPTSGLSPQAVATVANLVTSVVSRGTAVVWVVEQAPEFVLRRVQHAYTLEGGEVSYDGPPQALLNSKGKHLVDSQADSIHREGVQP